MPGPQSLPGAPENLQSHSFTVPFITYAGLQPIYALDGSGAGVEELNGLQGIVGITSTDSSIAIGSAGNNIDMSVNFPAFPQHVASINALDAVVSLVSSDNSLTFANVGQTIDIQVNPVAVVESLNTLEGVVNITSPGATIGITITGQDIELEAFGTAGVADLNGLSGLVTLTSPNNTVAIAVVGQNIEIETVSGGPANILSGADIFITADEGLTSISPADVNILAKNGGGGHISLISQAGGVSQLGGVITLESQGGSGVGGLFGSIALTAQSGTDAFTGITTGGLVNITANTGLSVGSLCSIVRQNAASIQSFAGAIPAIPSATPGFQTIYGNQGISLTAGLPAILPQVPFTIYQYATGGISLDSAVYTNQMYPYWDGLGAVPDLTISGRTLPSQAYVVLEDVKSIDMASSGTITGVISINGSAYPPPSGGSAAGPSGAIQYSDGAGGFQGNNGLLYNGTSKITNAIGNNLIDINETANANSIAIQSASQINLTATGILGLSSGNRLQMTSASAMAVNIGSSYGSAGQVLMSDGTFTEWQNVPAGGTPFVDAYQIYVAPNGNDTTGTGSQQKPYATIERAIVKRATIVNTIEVAIILSSGTYTPVGGGIVLTQNTFLCGIPTGEIAQPVNVFCQIGMQAGTGQCTLFGFSLFPNTSQAVLINAVGIYNISNCNITSAGNYCVVQSLGTLFMTNCRIVGPSSGVLPAIGGTGSAAITTIRDCLITTSGTPSLINHIGTLNVRQCNLLNTSVSASVNPLVLFAPTSSSTPLEISYCTLQYTSAVSALNKICVRTNSPAGITATIVNFIYNLLICEGAQSGTGPNNYHCVDKTGTGSGSINFFSCAGGPSAHAIDATMTKNAFNVVV